ncbi:MAG: 4Fe-4S ferredoxin [Deltaproteobacteria bacterium RIFOXYD12_FULL_57_12]|nr:MAG: 4Fe-4S ferredoxin [Deltaproteobacteria bacterium RIFOXYD12_FULL_57_12]
MGHTTDADQEYHFLQERICQKIQGNPASPTLMKILRLLFSPEDARLASRLPHNLTPVEALTDNLGIPLAELNDRLTEMAQRGVVFDLEYNGRRYVTLPPVVIGFFELVFMRTRPDLPMQELAHLFEQYFTENNGALAHSVWQGQTQLARAYVREETIPENTTEVLDWERATHIISSATAISVSICQCLHTAQHHGKGCDKPTEVCLSFNYAAESLHRNGHGRAITTKEAMDILARCKEANLVQLGDNVQRKVSFICNCCGCCCHMLRGMRIYTSGKGVVTSNWIMEVNPATCKGCGECARVCPLDAIRIAGRPGEHNGKGLAIRDEHTCLGCGVCSTVCKTGSATMRSRPQRVLVPETIFDQRVAMAIERGQLADLLFDDPEKLSHRALGRVLHFLEKSPPFKAAMACSSIKSSFLHTLVRAAEKQSGDLADVFK